MSVVSYSFFVFLFVLICVYYLVPRKLQWWVILAGNIVFYAFSGLDNLLIAVLTSAVAYVFSMYMQKNLDKQAKMIEGLERKEARAVKEEMKKKRKKLLNAALVIVIGVLAFLKYYNFTVQSINALLGVPALPGLELIAPLGISYYTFMLISYLVDVYKDKVKVDKNPAKFMAYILYFPQITQGPIARYGMVAPQILEGHAFDLNAIRSGLLLMLWGYMKKLVIADNLAEYVSFIMNWDNGFRGSVFLLASALFSIEIYCDFSGCMDIVRGTSECLGIKLSKNFERPYFSRTLPEFWRRWHMTLGEFFREYVFYPVSTTKLFLHINTKARQRLGNDAGRLAASCLPIMCVWLLTGLWHGASMNFIAWGLYHGILICLSTVFEAPLQNLRERLHINTENIFWRLFQMLRTFFLCMVGRIFFFTNSIGHSRYVFASILKYFGDFGQYSKFVIPEITPFVLIPACLAVLAVSVVQEYYSEKGEEIDLRVNFLRLKLPVRWLILLTGLVFIFLFGKYGNGYTVFIYDKF